MNFWFAAMMGGYGFGTVAAVLAPSRAGSRWLAAAGAATGSIAGLVLSLSVLFNRGSFALQAPWLLPVAGGLDLRLDSLGALFLAVIGLVAPACAVYGASYSKAYDDRYSQRQLGAMFNVFLATMSLVPCAANVLTFLVMWEGMSLTSYFLVVTEHGEPETVRAGAWYLAMTHGGLALIVTAFLLLASAAGSTAFVDLHAAAATLPPGVRTAVFLLALLGFGSKAGIMPLHVWLPRAHPAAPSHVSALMSGVMIKLGVYGLLRVVLDALGGGPPWWGALVIGLGALSAALGVLYALMENDLKRLLAYSSVENIGLIFIGVGAGLLFLSLGMSAAAGLAFAAALYHIVNHGAFKGLLFLGAGSALHASGSRDMNRMGGLIRGLPWTAFCFLVGSLAIAGLPPLNGFVSEWLLFQSLLPGVASHAKLVAPLTTLAIGVVALTGGLAAAGFVKAFGITFLAIPRSKEAEHAHEAPWGMRVGMGVLSAACLALGLAAVFVLPALGNVLAGHATLPEIAPRLGGGLMLSTAAGVARMSPLPLFAGLALAIAGVWAGARVFGSRRPIRFGDTWGCGRVIQSPRMEYTSTAFAEPLRRVFAELYRPTQDLSIDFHPESKYFVQSIEYRSEVVPWFEHYLYRPVIQALQWLAVRIRLIQSGSAHAYLAYIVVAVVALLTLLLVRGS